MAVRMAKDIGLGFDPGMLDVPADIDRDVDILRRNVFWATFSTDT